MPKPTFEVKITGPGISPETLDWDDLSDFVGSLKAAAYGVAEAEGFEGADEPTFSLVSIDKGGSARLRIAVPLLMLAAAGTVSHAVKSHDYKNLPAKSHQALRHIWNKTRARGCSVEFKEDVVNKIAPAIICPEDEVPPRAAQSVIRGTTTLYGRCLRVGGAEKPKAEVRVGAGDLIHIDVSEELARELARSLYEEVGLEGEATWSLDWKLQSFDLVRITNYRSTNPLDAFEKLSGEAGSQWEDIDAEEFVRNVRYGEPA